ncbi:class I SAM-dependent methyltransferase [Candidatus Woesearchaeota archaeon]|nr:class I SAM-dependent methyltransferase [Candidatus Woesearchaeota archaeon]
MSVREAYSNPEVIALYAARKKLWATEEILIRRYFRRGRTLDLGAGTGRTTHCLERAGYQPVALDLSNAMLAQAHFPRSVIGNAAQLPFIPGSFENALFSYNGLCHLTPHLQAMCIREVSRVLVPNGIFLFTIEQRKWYQQGILDWVIHAGSSQQFRCPFYRPWQKEILALLRQYGFRVLFVGPRDQLAPEKDYPDCSMIAALRESAQPPQS